MLLTFKTVALSPSLVKGGGIDYLREAKPLFDSPLAHAPSKEKGKHYLGRG